MTSDLPVDEIEQIRERYNINPDHVIKCQGQPNKKLVSEEYWQKGPSNAQVAHLPLAYYYPLAIAVFPKRVSTFASDADGFEGGVRYV